MANVFNKALPPPPEEDPQAKAYQALMAELQTPVKVSQGPSFSPDEVRARIAQNNQLAQLGLLGQVASDERIQRMGGSVFKKALADRDERQTDKGIQDPLTGETKIDPEYAAGLERTRRGQVLQQALGFEKSRMEARDRAEASRRHDETLKALAASRASSRGGSLGKPPTGYRWTADGDLEVIPGGPVAAKTTAAENKLAAGENALLGSIDNVIGMANKAAEQTGFWTTGLPGSVFNKVKGTEAYNLNATLDSIKANLGFNELSAMRQASPTGGALGQVAVQELKYLQAARANLDAAQSEEQLKASIGSIIKHYNNWKGTIQQAQAERGAGGATPIAPTPVAPPPVGGAVPPSVPPGQPRAQPAPAAGGNVRLRLDPATGQLVPAQ